MVRRIALVFAFLAFAHAAISQSEKSLQPGYTNSVRTQSPPTATRASPGASIFYLLAVGNSEQRPTFWADTLMDASVTPQEIERIRAYAKQVVTTNLEFQKRELGKMCAGSGNLTTLDRVAAALARLDVSNRSNIEQLGSDAAKSLGDKLGKLLVAAGARSTTLVSETNHKALMTAMNKEPVEHIKKVCSKSSSPAH